MIQNFMNGRAGVDQLCWVLLIFGLICSMVGSAAGWAVFNLLSCVILVITCWRMFSRNVEKRRKENAAFLGVFKHVKDREHRYFSCPKCRQRVRVPKGKGKISIRCPQCGERFVKKT